jgi:hypothetical protein
MKKLIAILALTAATPALASDGSEAVWHSQAQRGYVVMSNGMTDYAFVQRGNWQNANNGQWQVQSSIVDR